MDILNNAKPYIMYFATYYLFGIQLILIFLAFLAHELSERYFYDNKIGDILYNIFL